MSIDNARMPIGIDWGGTSIKGAVVDEARVVKHAGIETPKGEPGVVLDAIAALVRRLNDKPESVGVGIPGEVRGGDPRLGGGTCWRLPNVPGFEDVNIGAELTVRLGCPVAVENDAIAAALGERLYGWGNQFRSFLLVTLGTGIGGGVVLDGNVRRGRGGFAGEIGHVMVNSADDAWECGCGRRGCMESYAGTKGLLRRYRELGGEATSVQQIAETSDEAGDAVFQQLGESLGTGLAIINNVLDLDAIIFTGGVANSFKRFEPHIRKAIKARAFARPLGEIPIEVSQLTPNTGPIGAAHLPRNSEPAPKGPVL